MALSPFPRYLVTKAQAADRRVAAMKEGIERQGGGSRNLAPLCVRADQEACLPLNYMRRGGRNRRQRIGRLKKWGSRGWEILIGNKIKNESLLFNFYSWNSFVVLANNSYGGLSRC